MPGFTINNYGGNRTGLGTEQRFYTSYSWEVINIGAQLINSLSSEVRNRIMLRSANLPQFTFAKEEAEGGTIRYKYAGKPTFDDVRIQWYDSQGAGALYRTWVGLVFDHVRGVKPPNAYKSEFALSKYLADRPDVGDDLQGNTVSAGTNVYTLFGAWPVGFKESELTYLEASIKSVEVTICYDYFTVVELND